MEMSKSDLCKQRAAERNEKIVALHATGMLTKDIAKEVHASESTTCNILKKAGLSSHGALKNSTRKERFAAIRGQHAQGLTNIKIAEVVGLSPATVGQYVREMGLIPNQNAGIFGAAAKSRASFNERIKGVARLIKKGMSHEQIAAELRVTVGVVKKWYASAKMLGADGAPAVQKVAQQEPKRSDLNRGPLPVGHPIAVDAMWRGLEKYREPLAL